MNLLRAVWSKWTIRILELCVFTLIYGLQPVLPYRVLGALLRCVIERNWRVHDTELSIVSALWRFQYVIWCSQLSSLFHYLNFQKFECRKSAVWRRLGDLHGRRARRSGLNLNTAGHYLKQQSADVRNIALTGDHEISHVYGSTSTGMFSNATQR
jgi:hypothetical protein